LTFIIKDSNFLAEREEVAMELLIILLPLLVYYSTKKYLSHLHKKRLKRISDYITQELPLNEWFTVEMLVQAGFNKHESENVICTEIINKNMLAREQEDHENVYFPNPDADMDLFLERIENMNQYEFKYTGGSAPKRRRKPARWKLFEGDQQPGFA